ncbi:MAG: zinc ribbon domain-containing protein [Chloroflexia bacterium]|nr:zinc ribbon domain-containing protein [Chloroflexia bacterium]
MPIYEYRCGNCSAQVEILVRSADTVPHCPHCGAVLQERLLSAPYVMRGPRAAARDQTCCGREERCDKPPCAEGDSCHRSYD